MLRLILIGGSLVGIYMALDGMWVNLSTHGTPQVVSIDQVVKNPGAALPRFIEVKDAVGSVFVCTKDPGRKAADGSDACKEMKIPLLTASQEASLESGNQVTAAIILKADDALTEKCNQQKDCLDGVSFRGVTKGSIENDLDDTDKQILAQSKVVIDKNTVFLDMENQPDSWGQNIFELLLFVAMGFAAAFWRRKKKVTEEV